MKRIPVLMLLAFGLALMVAGVSSAQKGLAPKDVTLKFYRALKEKHYVEGFRFSVYRGAVEGLSASELKDLDSDFARTFAAIPDKIEVGAEQINGDGAVVALKFAGAEEPQLVGLIRVDGEWLVGDQETMGLVTAQGKTFFFNTRMMVNEQEAYDMLQRIMGAEIIYSQKFEGRFASMPDLIRLGGVPKDVDDGATSGYKFVMTLAIDKKSFSVTATPITYSRTGRLSFYADMNGIRGDDLKGALATPGAPVYRPKQ